MSYNAFLISMSQLTLKKKAHIVVQGFLVEIENLKKKNHLSFYTKVFDGDGYLPSSIRSFVSSVGYFRWHPQEAYLKLDPFSNTIRLIHEIEIEEKKYIPFRRCVDAFVQTAAEWKESLQELAEKDHVFTSTGL